MLIRTPLILGLAALGAGAAAFAGGKTGVPPAPNGIEFPADYRNWRTISVSHRIDHKSMRSILGNDIAIEAARAGNTNPWPDGAILAKVVWKETTEERWPTAIAPSDEFVHVEFMFKDEEKWKETGGWGYARWTTTQLNPYGKDAGFTQECLACHIPVKDQDYVFTRPAIMPNTPG